MNRKLKQFRLNNNLTLEEAAEYTEVSRATLGRIEQGLANPGQATIDKINKGIAKWNVEQIIWGLKDPDDPSFDRYTADEAQDILEFNKYLLSELDLELKLSGNSVEVWAGDAGYRVSIGDLRLIKEQVVKQYAAIFNERFPLGRTEQGKTHKEEETLMDIQQKLKQFRLNQNLSLDDVAEITGISKATLWRIETGDSNPTQKTIYKINSGIAKWNRQSCTGGNEK